MHKFVIIAGTVSVLFRCFVLFLDLLIPVLNHKTPSQQSLMVSRCNLNQSVVIYGAEQPPDFVAVSSSVEVFE